MQLDHIGIAIENATQTLSLFETLLGSAPYKEERVESEQVITHFFNAGGVKIELLEPTDSGSVIARFIEKRGPGIHHLAFEVDDLNATRDNLERQGFRVIGEGIKEGADGKRVFFLHPKEAGGVLIEYCSRSSAGD